MRNALRVLSAMLLVLGMLVLAAPAGATVVMIETTATLADFSEQSLDAALTRAVEASIGRAAAMGLSMIWFDQAFVLADRVVVRMVATDEVSEEDADAVTADPTPAPAIPQPEWIPRTLGARETL